MESDDWEKAYEAERRAMASGAAPAPGPRRHGAVVDDDSLVAEYYQGVQQQQPEAPPPSAGSQSNEQLFGAANPPSQSSAGAPQSKAAASALPAPSAFSAQTGPTQLGGFPTDDAPSDCRYSGLAYDRTTAIPPLLAERCTRFCFFFDAGFHYTKAFIGTSKHPAYIAVTSHSVTVFDAESGAAVGGIGIGRIATCFVFGAGGSVAPAGGVGLRAQVPKGQEAFQDYFIKFEKRRNEFIEVLKKLYPKVAAPPKSELENAYYSRSGADSDGPQLNVLEKTEEKPYRNDMTFHGAGKFMWPLMDDVRSGLEAISVPTEHQQAYKQLCVPTAPKILHYFGGVNHLTFSVPPNAGKKAQPMFGPVRRGCWITPSTLFLSLPHGPGDFGQGITRAVYIERLRSIIISSAGGNTQIGLVTTEGMGDTLIELDSPALRNKVVFVLTRVFRGRTRQPLFVRSTTAAHLKDDVRIIGDTKPAFGPMFTVPELLAYLKTPTKK